MQALTKLNPTDPVRFDSMNAILGEIEGRDNELAKQLNDCFKVVENVGYKSALDWGKNNKNKSLKYNGFNWTDVPPGKSGVWGDMWTIYGNSITIYFKQNNENVIYYRTINNNAWVGDWQQIATTNKTTNVTLLNGWSVNSSKVIISRSGNQVTLTGNITGGIGVANTLIFNIPTEYLPATNIGINVSEEQGGGVASILRSGVIDKNLQGLRISSVGGNWVKAININASYTI